MSLSVKSMLKSYLILGIGTGVGKTFLMESLCRILPDSIAIKPIVSGFQDDDKNSDSAKILAALGRNVSKKNLDEISPWRFEMPVSPHLAGEINFSAVKKFCQKKILQAGKENRNLFIESAGGVMTPITAKKTFLDLAKELQVPILLVSSNYLGSINHTLCAITALKAQKIAIEKVIINENFSSQIKTQKLIKTIRDFGGIATVSMKNFLQKIHDQHNQF